MNHSRTCNCLTCEIQTYERERKALDRFVRWQREANRKRREVQR